MNNILKIIISLYFIFITSSIAQAQIAINSDGSSPDASAMLDVNSSDKGLLAPRMTTTEREAISSPATGLLVYDTDENSFWYYDSSEWIEIDNHQYNNTQSPELINTLDIGSQFSDMEQSGDYLYLTDFTESKVYVYDISNPTTPTFASSLTFASSDLQDIAIDGNYAYVGSSNNTNEFKVIDISDPTNISSVGEFDIGSRLSAIEIDGNYAYAADNGADKLRVIDISTPSNPVQVDELAVDFRLSGGEETIIIEDNYLYLGYQEDITGKSYLSIIDISTPTSISITGTHSLSSSDGIYHIKKREDYLYMNTSGSIRIVDVSTPSSPSNSGFLSYFTEAFTISEDYLFVNDYPSTSSEISIYDISTSTALSVLHTIQKTSSSSSVDLIVVDGYLYSAESNGNLEIYQIASTSVNAIGIDGTVSSHQLYDDLGNHTATENLQIGDFWLSNDGDDEGISIADDGNTTLSGTLTIGNTYTLPSTDGNASQLLITDGNGTLSWSDATSNVDTTLLSDADADTKIQVEESSDEDIIRFDLGGTEFLRLDSGRIEVLNTGGSIIIGESAGENNDYAVGLNNIFLGKNSGYTNSIGNSNIFIGGYAGYDNTFGAFNIFTGLNSGQDNTTGSYNIFNGIQSGYSNTTGWHNIFTGLQAGYSTTTGNYNIFTGFQAGYSNISGEKNIFLGYQAGYNETGSNKLYVDNSNSSTPLIYGEFDNDLLQINGTLNINGAFDFPTIDGSANEVLVTDGSGTLSWSEIDNTLISDADADTKIQVEESSDEDIIRFDLGGMEQMQLNSSELDVNGNIAFGTSNLFQLDEGSWKDANITLTSGDGTFGIHSPSGTVDLYVDGSLNTRTGLTIGHSSTYTFPDSDGSANQFLATDGSGILSWTDLDNTLLSDADADTKIQVEESSDEDIIRFDLDGTEYLRLENGRIEPLNTGRSIFIGEDAGKNDDLSGNNNIFIGHETGDANTSGDYNLFCGNLAGGGNTTGKSNVYLGYFAGAINSTGQNNIFLGYLAGTSETTSNKLYIESSASSSPLIYGEFDNDRVVINGNYTDNSNSRTLFINGDIGATSAFNNDSDRRLKTDIQTIPNALDKVLEMRGVTYQWKDGREAGDRMGFIAQEVEPILPEVVDNTNDHYTMQYAPITAVLIEAVKEQQAQIEQLKIENAQLKISNKEIQKSNEQLKTEVAKINQQQSEINQLKGMLQQLQSQLNNPTIQHTVTDK